MRKRKYGHFLKGTSAIYFVSLEVLTYGDPNNSYCSNKTKNENSCQKVRKIGKIEQEFLGNQELMIDYCMASIMHPFQMWL